MTTRKIDQVKKRDGRVVPYDESRLAEAIYRAARAAGTDNRFLSTDLAGVVTLYLERYHQKETPTSQEIQEMVEKILFETGHPEIAKAYIVYNQTKVQQHVGVPKPGLIPEGLFQGESVMVDPATRDEASTWDKDRIADALVKEIALSAEEAQDIARAVEQKIFRINLQRVTTELIRGLVENELVERGYSAKLGKQNTIGLPKYDLKKLISVTESAERRLDPEQLCLTIGETSMKQYALQELYDSEVGNAHKEGRIHIHNLEYPLKLYWLAPPIEYLRRHGIHIAGLPATSAMADSPRTLTTQLTLVFNHARKFFSEAIEYNHLNVFYAPLLERLDRSQVEAEAVHLLLALNQLSYSTGAGKPVPLIGLDLGVPSYLKTVSGVSGDHEQVVIDFTRELLQGWKAAKINPRWGGPQEKCLTIQSSTFQDPRTVALLREACQVAATTPPVLFVFDRGAASPYRISRYATVPLASRTHPEETWFCFAHAVTLNLAQVLYRAESSGVDFYAELDGALQLAVRAHLGKRELLKRFVNRETGTFGEHLGWTAHGNGALRFDEFGYALGIAGLDETVSLMCGKAMPDGDHALRLGQQIVSYLYMKIREEEAKHHIRLTLEDIGQDDAVARLARIDGQMYRRARTLWSESSTDRSYSPGFRVGKRSPVLPKRLIDLEGRFHILFNSGKVCLSVQQGAGLSEQDIFDLVHHAFAETHVTQLLFQ